jgi:hypothetical protein
MYPHHLEHSNRLMYVVINVLILSFMLSWAKSGSLIPIIVLGLLFIVNLYIFVISVFVEDRIWDRVIISASFTGLSFMAMLIGFRIRY